MATHTFKGEHCRRETFVVEPITVGEELRDYPVEARAIGVTHQIIPEHVEWFAFLPGDPNPIAHEPTEAACIAAAHRYLGGAL